MRSHHQGSRAVSVSIVWLVLWPAGVFWAGCTDPDVVAVVGKTDMRKSDLEVSSRHGQAQHPEDLDVLIDRQLLAEHARSQGLQDDPRVRARIAAAEREVLAQEALERAVADAVSDEKLRSRYESLRSKLEKRELTLAHIFVLLPPGSSPEMSRLAQARINQAYARLVGGEPFEKVAREMSEDATTATRGGDLGTVREGTVDPAFFQAALALKRGEYSKPFQSATGLHVVKALEAPRTVAPSFEEVKGKLVVEARREAESKLLEDLRKNIGVKRYPDRFADGGQPPKPTPKTEGL